MDIRQRNDIEHACARLLIAFSNLNDAGQFEEMIQLFTEDGKFSRPSIPGKFLVGKEEILAGFNERPKDRVSTHLLSNILIDVQDENNAKGGSYILLYTGNQSDSADLGIFANSTQLIGTFDAEFSVENAEWKISKLSGDIIFTIQDN